MRVVHLKEALEEFSSYKNAIFCGIYIYDSDDCIELRATVIACNQTSGICSCTGRILNEGERFVCVN
jgi:hypothetical protein